MDAFSVSLANGLADRGMNAKKVSAIAGTFAMWQFMMPLAGWVLVHTAAESFEWFDKAIPGLAFFLLGYIGGKMIREGLLERGKSESEVGTAAGGLTFATLMLQGIATSIDALSVGFTTASYDIYQALGSSLIIGVVTFVICMAGVLLGRKLGTKLSWGASVLGGTILIVIAFRIILTSDVLKIIT